MDINQGTNTINALELVEIDKIGVRKALYVAIEDYENEDGERESQVRGSVEETKTLMKKLITFCDGKENFSQVSECYDRRATTSEVTRQIKMLLSGKAELALFYFSGHGTIGQKGTEIVMHDHTYHFKGIDLNRILHWARLSDIESIIIILDCCYSDGIGFDPHILVGRELARIPEKVSILSSSGYYQMCYHKRDSSIFTSHLLKGLDGKAKDREGRITIESLYSFISKEMSSNKRQRPHLEN